MDTIVRSYKLRENKLLVEPVFEFAKELLIKKTIELNQGSIYQNENHFKIDIFCLF